MLNPQNIPDCRAVLIAGPTASGKSRLALEIAAARGGIVINADSMQVYNRWRILTVRPSKAEEEQVPHALFGHIRGQDQYSVGDWLKEISEILSDPGGRLPVIVGGTGLYFRALTEGLAAIPQADPQARASGQRLLDIHGPEYVAERLRRLDPDTFQELDKRNPARLLRAWEVLETTGKGLKAWQNETPPPLLPVSDAYPLLLDPDKRMTSDCIDARLQWMVTAGALEECAAALADWDPDQASSKAIGASDFIAYLQGHVSLAAAVSRAAAATRQYAKRQRTWFRARMKGWLKVGDK